MALDARGYFYSNSIIRNKQSYLNGLTTTTTTAAPTTTTTSAPTTTTTAAPTTTTTTGTTTAAPTTTTTTSGPTTTTTAGPTTTSTTTTAGPTTTTTTGTTTETPISMAATTIGTTTSDSTLRPYAQGVYDRYSDKSFFCTMQNDTSPHVTECDHSGGLHTWGTPQQVYQQTNTQKYNYPTIGILPDRRLVLSYASPFDEYLGFAISDNPADATSWTTSLIDTGSFHHIEYPRVMVDWKGYIYLFYIHRDPDGAGHKRWYYYVKSEDSGVTWGSPTLTIERPLEDIYGMCEIYVGSLVQEPYTNGTPEKWWMTWTASSGFEYQGTHAGPDDSANLICADTELFASGDWASFPDADVDGSGFSYRWLYNRTKVTQAGIDTATAGTVVPESAMDWDIGDEYGIAYHTVHHSDLFVAYFRPDTAHWYDSGDNDLGTYVTTADIENTTGRGYSSITPPHGKDTGFTPVMTVNDSGEALIVHQGAYRSWNGSSWDVLIPDIGIDESGTHTGGDGEATVLIDSTASFTIDEWDRDFIYNVTDNSWGRVTSNTATTVTCSGGLLDGTENVWNNGDEWQIMGAGDFRYIWWVDGYYYWLVGTLGLYRSVDAITWTTVDTTSLPDRNGYGSYAVFSKEPHAEAAVNQHEYTSNNNGTAWGVSFGETQVPVDIILRSDATNVGTSTTTNVRAYVCDNVYGAKSRVRNATNSITLSVISGNATIVSSPISATNGLATFTINSHTTTDETIFEATGSGLNPYRIHIFTDTSL